MNLHIFLIAAAVFVSTLLGGFFAVSLRRRLHVIQGFSAGAVVGVAFFDLLPEALSLMHKSESIWLLFLCSGLGFLSYMLLDRAALSTHAIDTNNMVLPANRARGTLGAVCLVAHSCLDGIAIGFGFQVSASVGALIAAAVLAHDFADGINTVNIVVKGGGTTKDALRWLVADAAAPVIGIFLTMWFILPTETFAWILAVFSGFFLYLGAAELVPESYRVAPCRSTTLATVLGAALILTVVSLAS